MMMKNLNFEYYTDKIDNRFGRSRIAKSCKNWSFDLHSELNKICGFLVGNKFSCTASLRIKNCFFDNVSLVELKLYIND